MRSDGISTNKDIFKSFDSIIGISLDMATAIIKFFQAIEVTSLTNSSHNQVALEDFFSALKDAAEPDTLPWHLIWGKPHHPAATYGEIKNQYRILHRGVSLRIFTDKSAPCRLCHQGRDTISHWHRCPCIQEVFKHVENPPSPELIYLGLYQDRSPLQGADSLIYTLLRKFTLIAFTKVDMDNTPFDPIEICKLAIRRSATRLEEALSASGLAWTTARPGFLSNAPTSAYRAERDHLPPNGTSVSRQALAAFLVDALDDPATHSAAYGVSDRAA